MRACIYGIYICPQTYCADFDYNIMYSNSSLKFVEVHACATQESYPHGMHCTCAVSEREGGYMHVVFMYMYMCIYTCTYILTCIRIYIHTHIRAYKHAYTYIHIYTHTNVHTHIHIYKHLYIVLHTHIHIYMHIYIYVCMYVYIHTYICVLCVNGHAYRVCLQMVCWQSNMYECM